MKVYKKNSRIIVVDNEEYCWLVKEEVENVILRVYSTKYKSSYFDVVSYWIDNHDLNLNKPGIVESIIRFALDKGWNPNVHNRKEIFSYENEVAKEIE